MSSNAASLPLTAADSQQYRQACARFATGITVVTVTGSDGEPHGMTVNSFSSVSLDPPLVLVSIDLRNAILNHFLASSSFAINILAEDQRDISQRFSTSASNRFDGVGWLRAESGCPLLAGVLAQLECSVVRTFEAGDHTILIGQVVRAGWRDAEPLLYFGSSYRALAPVQNR